jgi:DNA polymerase III delta prime subunit
MRHFTGVQHLRHHAFVIEAEAEEGIQVALGWVERELEMNVDASNPDVVVLRHGLFSVADARRVLEIAASVPFVSEHVVIITASRAYHEAQNALLKLFEEPPPNTYIFFILPSLGGLLPTLRSRVQILNASLDLRGPTSDVGPRRSYIPKEAEEFMKANKEKRSVIIKKLTSGRDEEERRELRDEAIAIVNGIEAVAYATVKNDGFTKPIITTLLSDIAILRSYLYDRSAPVKMIMEHLSLVLPKDLL